MIRASSSSRNRYAGPDRRAVELGLSVAVFTGDLFATGHDVANRAAVRAVPGDQLDLVGLAVYGPRNPVDKVVKGARMHP
ncbi:DUF2000 family protein [Solwaraspora sp. WMMB335]|uniref:DUF2000 family protein n=1 Tax=Solwaraspora sp. WMMB335 TaxID=3404118 RepID=UPI003B946718